MALATSSDTNSNSHDDLAKSDRRISSTSENASENLKIFDEGDDKHNDNETTMENNQQHGKEATNDEGPEIVYPSGLRLILILTATVLCILLVALDLAIVSTAIPKITDDFHSLSDVGWYGSGYFMTLAIFQTVWGKAYKFWPIKLVYLLSMFIFEVGSLICALAPSSAALIIGRAIAGVGGGGITAGSYLIIGLSAPPAKIPALQGVLGVAFAAASIAGPLLGGVFTSYVSWRWCFYINLPLGGVAAGLVVLFYHNPAHVKPIAVNLKEKLLQLDPLGTLTLVGAFACLFVALQKAGVTDPWNSSVVIGTLVGAGIMFILFIPVEYLLGDRAAFQGRFFRDKTTVFQLVFQILIAGSFFVMLYYLPIYFQAVKNTSPAQSGVRTIPLVGMGSISVMVVGIWLMNTGEYQPAMLFGTALLSVGSGLIYTFNPDTSAGKWIGYQIITGVGVGLSWQLAVMVLQGFSSVEDMSTVSALALFFQIAGGAIWISVSQSIFSNTLVKAAERNLPGVSPALLVGAGATELRNILKDPEQIQAGINSYMEGLRNAFALSIALAGAGFVVALISVFADRRKLSKKQAASAM